MGGSVIRHAHAMKRGLIAAAALAAILAVAVAAMHTGLPYLWRIRLHHLRNAEGMTHLAEAVVNRHQDFNWIALVDGEVEAGDSGFSRANLAESTKARFRALFDGADLYYLTSHERNEHVSAGVQISSGRRDTKTYWVYIYYRSQSRENRSPCEDGFFNSSLGGCFVDLDSDWIYELSWLDDAHVFPEVASEK